MLPPLGVQPNALASAATRAHGVPRPIGGRESEEQAAQEAAEAARQAQMSAELHAAETAAPWGAMAASNLADKTAHDKAAAGSKETVYGSRW